MGFANKLILGFVIGLIGYLGFYPVEDFQPQTIPNIYLSYNESIVDDKFVTHMKAYRNAQMHTPQDLDIDEETGQIYTGLLNGSIIRVDGQGMHVLGQGRGGILGVKLSSDKKHVYFADLTAGLSRLDLSTGEVQVLASGYQGVPFKLLDNFDIASDGKIYMTDASVKYPHSNFFMDVIQGKPHGRLYVYDPQTKAVKLLLDKLYFPNGIQVSPDQSALYFSETTAYRISKYQLTGQHAGQYEVIIDGLPGSPDNIKFNDKGELWVAVPSFRDSLSDQLMQWVFIRKLVARLPKCLHRQLANRRQMGGFKMDVQNRKLITILRSSDVSKTCLVTTILEKRNRLYFGSLGENVIGVLELSEQAQGVVD